MQGQTDTLIVKHYIYILKISHINHNWKQWSKFKCIQNNNDY